MNLPAWVRGVSAAAFGASLLTAAACGSAPEKAAPEIARLDFTLKDLNGHDVKLSDFKGKPLVVNFWATWCGPCQLETPELEQMWQKYRAQGLMILGVETESQVADVRKFAADYKVTYPLLIGLDREDIQTAFSWTGTLPTSVFVRADGTIAGRLQGMETQDYWDKRIRALF